MERIKFTVTWELKLSDGLEGVGIGCNVAGSDNYSYSTTANSRDTMERAYAKGFILVF